jgi:DNA polymerase III subunit epsilon
MFLFFDTETTGMPKRWGAPVTDLQNWPRMVQLAWASFDEAGAELASGDAIVQPDGFTIPQTVANIHGITTAKAQAEGRPLAQALEEFTGKAQAARALVAHNMSFDSCVIGAEYLRTSLPNPVPKRKQICTMLASTNYCQLPGPNGYKWPKLEELHRKLFGQVPDVSHRALSDVRTCARCFFELKRLGVLRSS